MPAWLTHVTEPASQLNDKVGGVLHGANALFGPSWLAVVTDSNFQPADPGSGHQIR